MTFDRDRFFTGIREAFGPLRQSQVDGLNALLPMIESDPRLVDVRHIAYILATVKHETAGTYEPIVERGQRSHFDQYEAGTRKGHSLGNRFRGDGYLYRGRGYVQITGRRNYERYGIADEPDRALEPAQAYEILVGGMLAGAFTGKKLGDYLTPSVTDYRNARRTVNGTDRADQIADYARAFERILIDARADLCPCCGRPFNATDHTTHNEG